MRLAGATLLGLAAALAPLCAGAAGLDVTPVRIELTGKTPSALLTLRNTEASPARFQIRAYSWDESPSGGMILGETSDLQVFPALQQLGPKEERKIRLGTTAKPGARERSWRIFIEELPSAVEAEDKNRIRVLTRIGIPVFLAPSAPAASGELRLGRAGGRVEVRLRSTGTIRIQPSDVTLVLLGDGDAKVHEQALSPWYVLSGGERVYPVDVPPALCAKARRAVATATLDKGQIQAILALPDGACAP